MTSVIADTLVKLAGGAGGGGVVVAIIAFVQAMVNGRNRRAEAARIEAEAQERGADAYKTTLEAKLIDRNTWFKEADELYAKVKAECVECEKKLDASEERHSKELGIIRRELSEVKDALFGRINAFDEILPYVVGVPDEKIRELRAANRAVRLALFWGPS